MKNFNTISVNKLFPLLLVFYSIALYLSNDAYLPALPTITENFSSTITLAQLTLTLWFLGACSVQLLIGPICDRYGRRPILLTGGLVFTLSSVACMTAHNMEILLIARFIQGASIPTMIIAGFAVIHELFDQKQAIKTISTMNSITILAPALGPLAGSLLLYIMVWQGLFAILAIWAAVALVSLWFIMPETLSIQTRHAIDLRMIIKNYTHILSNVAFMRYTCMSGCAFGAMIAWICVSSFLIIEQFHYTLFCYGIMQAFIFGGFILGSRLVLFLIEHLLPKIILRASIIIIVCSSLMMVILSTLYPAKILPIIISVFFLAIGSGLGYAILNRLAIESSDAPMGSRIAIFSWCTSVFAVLGSLIASYFGKNSQSFSLAILILGIVGLIIYSLPVTTRPKDK